MIDLEFNRVSKRYLVRHEATTTGGKQNRLLGRLAKLRRRSEEFWAVRDVSFAVERGEALGIIGHNGAGKSTILKLLSSITAPTAGEITINGRLSALIEVGSGFHPELTGRENVYLSGSILGMRRREITEKLERIVDFAGVRQFIDTPVKRYSSGMYVRLGFAIAAHLDPDILLLDEVLAVGDAAFQTKCFQRIDELRAAGKTIVFISHDLGAVERLCDRALLLRRGQIMADGAPRQVIEEYKRLTTDSAPPLPPGQRAAELPQRAKITSLTFLDSSGQEPAAFCTGEPLTARLEYVAREPVPNAIFGVFFYSHAGEEVAQFSSELSGERIDLEPGPGVIEFVCPQLGLQPGVYFIDATVEDNDWQHRCATLRVDVGKRVRGSFYMPHTWRLAGRDFDGSGSYQEPLLTEVTAPR